jgi:hypothetical protein
LERNAALLGRLVIDFSDIFNPGRRHATLEGAFGTFAACFCEAHESKFMWRQYGDCFRGASIRVNGVSFSATPRQFGVYPMVYDQTDFKRVLIGLFDYVVSRDWNTKFNFSEGRTIAFEVTLLLMNFLFRMKRDFFRQECEWRALKLNAGQNKPSRDEQGREYFEISLTNSDIWMIEGVKPPPDFWQRLFWIPGQ